jgi:phenylalanyl-tRNA synthetase, beta subunit, non-spirochete bacterial
MKFSVNWLGEFVELPPTVDELAEVLTMGGIEIESIDHRGADFDNIVVAQIKESRQHPNADRLTVCMVDDGSGHARQIVCGAKNYKVGDKVPLALPGAELSGGLKISVSKLRGVESEGMLCSGKELGMGDDASGLLILSPDVSIGAPIAELFPPDSILNVEITPNRGDLLSHFGLAREIAALTEKKLNPTPLSNFAGNDRDLPPATTGTITISALRECPFFSARRIENLKVGPSPSWLRARIEAAGVRSINNIVDLSNFVMLELGQPTHAFDADKLRGRIHVRLAREGERFLALDGKTYTLTPQNLVIADEERAIGIGGVMGGEETAVTDATKNVLLESAYFLPASVRRTARTLNLPSDASYRFERGVDPQMVLRASNRATELMRGVADGRPQKNVSVAGDLPSNPLDVSLRYDRCNGILGTQITRDAVDRMLSQFGLHKGGEYSWRVPSYRRDLQREEDLIEEVVRAYGIENVASANRSRFTPATEADALYDFETNLRRELTALGLNEARTTSLVARGDDGDAANRIQLRNPLSEDHATLRLSLLPNLLEVLGTNIRSGAQRVALFEIGNVFGPEPTEQKRGLACVLWGKPSANWRVGKQRTFDYFDLKGVIESLELPELKFRRGQRPGLILTAEVLLGKKRIGFCGQLERLAAEKLDASEPVLVAEFNLAEIAHVKTKLRSFREMHRYPAVKRDIAMFVAPNVTHAEILRVIAAANEPLLERVELFDLFTEKVAGTRGETPKSLAYSLTYRDKNRTLTTEEVSAAHARIRQRLKSEIRAELRE